MRNKILGSYNLLGSRKLLILVITSFSLLGCAGKQKITDENGEPIVDMTRPPIMIGDIREQRVESNPDEVISYEKWKQQQDETQAQENKTSDGESQKATPE